MSNRIGILREFGQKQLELMCNRRVRIGGQVDQIHFVYRLVPCNFASGSIDQTRLLVKNSPPGSVRLTRHMAQCRDEDTPFPLR